MIDSFISVVFVGKHKQVVYERNGKGHIDRMNRMTNISEQLFQIVIPLFRNNCEL